MNKEIVNRAVKHIELVKHYCQDIELYYNGEDITDMARERIVSDLIEISAEAHRALNELDKSEPYDFSKWHFVYPSEEVKS